MRDEQDGQKSVRKSQKCICIRAVIWRRTWLCLVVAHVQAERSRYNRELYRGPSTLPPLPDDAHTVADGSDDDDSYGDGDSADGVSVAGGDEDGGNEDQDGSGSDEDSD